MSSTPEFVEPPRVEWHNRMPYVLSALPVAYAHELAALALAAEPGIVELAVTPGWESLAAENPTGSRHSHYNALTLSERCEDLRLALRQAFRVLLAATDTPERPTTVRAWCNVHREGQRLVRHWHKVPYIGSFIAWGAGSTTAYGLERTRSSKDHVFENVDGRLLVTLGSRHYHEVSPWTDTTHPRVSYAFNIKFADVGPAPEGEDGQAVILTGGDTDE